MATQLDVPPPPPPYSAVAPPSPPRLDCLPYDVLVRILRLATVSYAFLEERLAAVWWLVRDGRLVSRTLRDVIQLHLRTTLYPVYLANIRPPFLSSFSPPLPRQPLSTPGAAHDVVTFFSTHAHLHELRALNRFIVAHTHGQSVRGESELMLDGGDEWKLEVFTMLQPETRLLDLLLAHPSLRALVDFPPALIALSFNPRRLTLWRLHPSRAGLRTEIGSLDRTKGEGEDSLVQRLLAALGDAR